MRKKIITGDWDGRPIWRWERAGEELARELEVPAEFIEGIDHVVKPDLRSEAEHRAEEVYEEIFNNHKHD